jgi:hypothetical protein
VSSRPYALPTPRHRKLKAPSCDSFRPREWFVRVPAHARGVSLNQSYHSASLYSVKGVHDVVPIEYSQEMFNRPGDVARPFNIFPQDASSVLNGTN